MKLLELFSGTGSIGKAAKRRGYDVVSLDLKNADINCDILKWNYKEYPSGYFDFIHASPPCVEYSRAKTVGVRKIEETNRIVLKTLEIIECFNPRIWFIENPQTGLLKNQEFMKWIPYKDVDYCIASMALTTENGLGYGIIFMNGNLNPCVKNIATWTETVIKKARNAEQVN